MTKTELSEVLPLPPFEMRQLIGLTDEAAFDNPTGTSVVPNIAVDYYNSVFDFGCGCGRIARKLLQQKPRPRRYLGIDLHAGMVNWCQQNLSPYDRAFEFQHHDIFNAGFNPDPRKPKFLDLPASDRSFSLILAWSVFTHLTQSQAEHYLKETARILRDDGILVSTWFLFEKRYFPMMQDFQNALYINESDLCNAVVFDREWLELILSRLGLNVIHVVPPAVRGFQWEIHVAHASSGRERVVLPTDNAPFGRVPPPVLTRDPSLVGVGTDSSSSNR
jgi:SAM-dependent methyltransferase